MCDAIRDTDQNYQSAMDKVDRSGCAHENTMLTECLSKTDKDWRVCQPLVQQLSQCH